MQLSEGLSTAEQIIPYLSETGQIVLLVVGSHLAGAWLSWRIFSSLLADWLETSKGIRQELASLARSMDRLERDFQMSGVRRKAMGDD